MSASCTCQVHEALIFIGTAHTAKRLEPPIVLLDQLNDVSACGPSLLLAPSQGRQAEGNDQACSSSEREMEYLHQKYSIDMSLGYG